MPLWTPRPSVRGLSILLPHAGYAPGRTGKTVTEICPGSGQISVTVFVQRRLGKAHTEPSVLVGDFCIRMRKVVVLNFCIWYNKSVEFSDQRYPYGHLL